MIRVEHHDRYLAIRDEFVRLLNCVQWNNKLGQDDLLRFKGATHEARSLFGPEIPAYADEVLAHGRKLWVAKTQLNEMPPGDERQRSLEVQHAEEGWLLQQYKVVDEKFTRYLDLSN
jgi:hypothetical protein